MEVGSRQVPRRVPTRPPCAASTPGAMSAGHAAQPRVPYIQVQIFDANRNSNSDSDIRCRFRFHTSIARPTPLEMRIMREVSPWSIKYRKMIT